MRKFLWMLFFGVAIAMLFGVADVKADITLMSINKADYDLFASKYQEFSSGQWLNNARPYQFGLTDPEGKTITGKVNILPPESHDEFTLYSYPNAYLQFKPMPTQALVFTFDLDSEVSAFTFALDPKDSKGTSFNFWMSYTLSSYVEIDGWLYDSLNEIYTTSMTVQLEPNPIRGDVPIYFGLEATKGFITELSITFRHGNGNANDQFNLKIGSIYAGEKIEAGTPVTPEPATLLILGLSLAGAAGFARRRR